MKPQVAVYDTKLYDREALLSNPRSGEVDFHFHSFRLEKATTSAAKGSDAVCLFVNDHVDGEILPGLVEAGVGHIALRCAGFNNVHVKCAQEAGIRITRVPAYSPHAVAEHTLALLLSLNRCIHRAYNRVREQNFSLAGLVGFDLHGKTMGIIGTGKIGAITAEICRGFGMRVLAYDPFPQPDWANDKRIVYTEMEDLMQQADVVSLHVPLTQETEQMINVYTLSLMKKGVVLLNVSRGGLVDTGALILALKSGHVGGVGLDVYEEEEGVFFEDLSGQVLQDDELARLLTFPNVLVTSHQAFLTHEALNEISRVTIENILNLSQGKDPLPGTELLV